jgi:hypothetical protein
MHRITGFRLGLKNSSTGADDDPDVGGARYIGSFSGKRQAVFVQGLAKRFAPGSRNGISPARSFITWALMS